MANNSPIALLGGTFDPVHNGHIGLADDVRRALALSEVRLVPAGDPASSRRPVGGGQRSRRDAASGGRTIIAASSSTPREVERRGKSYTVLTLEELRQEAPSRPLLLLVGADAFLGFPTWHRWRDLFALAHVVVVAQPRRDRRAARRARGGVESAPGRQAGRSCFPTLGRDHLPAGDRAAADFSHRDSRATWRAAPAGREAVVQMLPPAVLRYIDQHHLYSERAHPQDAT